MISIINEQFIRFEGERSVVVAELRVDSSDELPDANALSGKTLSQGSLAWDISTGNFYALKSTGEWINQTGG